MKKILMILTSHRLDCLRLTMDLLTATDSFSPFDRVVLLLNGVVGRHLRYLQGFMAAHPEVPWDTVSGPRGKGELVANLQNECVRRYPDSLYFKVDEDVFVSKGWVQKMQTAYEAFRQDDNLALLTPISPNNGAGFYWLLSNLPDLAAEYRGLFPHPIVPDCDGPVWIYPQIAEWITRKFLDLDAANRMLEGNGPDKFAKFSYRFSINCLVYDYRHWIQMGGVPKEEEPAWGRWVGEHGKFNVLVTNTLVHHYSFFVQQDRLDRSSLLEDIQQANLRSRLGWFRHEFPRWNRVLKQIPRAVIRRITASLRPCRAR